MVRAVFQSYRQTLAHKEIYSDKLNLNIGDYCLGTKWSDGDSGDPWAVGFYDGEPYEGRHRLVDSDQKVIYGPNGFRKCGRITQGQGGYLVKNSKEIEQARVNLWEFIETLPVGPAAAEERLQIYEEKEVTYLKWEKPERSCEDS